jgi:CRP/FNR family transcriptional regulator, polysaccharide utilization system transcription regulator
MQKKNNTPQHDCHSCSSRYRSVFCDLNEPSLSDISDTKACGSYKKGQTIFTEGHYPQGLFCINAGKVKVSQLGEYGKEQIVRLAREGDILGYRALLSGDKYSCSGIALDDSDVCFIPKEVVFKIINNEASLSMSLMKLLSGDLKQVEHRLTELAQKPVRERLAEALLFIKETYGFEEDGKTISVVLTREEIANIVGTATETCIRLLSDLKSDGLVSLEGKKIKILDVKKLARVANIPD